MLEIKCEYNSALAYVKDLENGSIGQLTALCNQEFVKGEHIRTMPDARPGVGCVIGTTMTVSDKIVSNLVEVDIGCGMEVVKLGKYTADFKKLDSVIRKSVPCGTGARRE